MCKYDHDKARGVVPYSLPFISAAGDATYSSYMIRDSATKARTKEQLLQLTLILQAETKLLGY